MANRECERAGVACTRSLTLAVRLPGRTPPLAIRGVRVVSDVALADHLHNLTATADDVMGTDRQGGAILLLRVLEPADRTVDLGAAVGDVYDNTVDLPSLWLRKEVFRLNVPRRAGVVGRLRVLNRG